MEATNFDVRLTREQAIKWLRTDPFPGYDLMCKEYGDDDDWVGMLPDDLDYELDEAGGLDSDYQTFEVWCNGPGTIEDVRKWANDN